MRHAAFCVISVALLGCGRGDGLVPVGGVVTLDGQPLAGAAVMFHHDDGQTAYGLSDSAGRFRLTTHDPNDGARCGRHRVTVTLAVTEGGVQPNAENLEDYKRPIKPAKTRFVVPESYGNAKFARLTVEVTPDATEFDLPLASK